MSWYGGVVGDMCGVNVRSLLVSGRFFCVGVPPVTCFRAVSYGVGICQYREEVYVVVMLCPVGFML